MGGRPVVAVNLLGWPRDVLPMELAAEVLRGGLDVARQAGCHLAGGHSVDDPEPKYGLAVTGIADPDRLLRNDAGKPGMPLSLTKPLGIGVLNSRHKATGEVFPAGHRGDDDAQRATPRRPRVAAGVDAPPTSPGSGCWATCTSWPGPAASPPSSTPRRAVPRRRPRGRCGRLRQRRHAPQPRLGAPAHRLRGVDEDEALLLADAQTSGGLLLAGEMPGAPVIGELVPRGEHPIVVR